MKKLANILSTILLVLLLAVLTVVVAVKFLLGWEMKAVLTGSMEPEMPVGSLIIIEPIEYGEIAVGDDITFVRDANLTLVTHRVIEKDDETQKITTQGIANSVPDTPTSYQNVVGRVKFNIPYVGYLVIWTSDTKGKIICGIIIAALVAFSLLFSDSEKSKTSGKSAEESGGENADGEKNRVN